MQCTAHVLNGEILRDFSDSAILDYCTVLPQKMSTHNEKDCTIKS
jgi:hypothetical protein